MPVAPTYPGVYIEEIPSGVRTITGVSTSVTAFVGYTAKGEVDEAVHIFSFADFERAFGGLSIDSPLSYCVKHFFQNGGSEAYVVRVAQGAAAASVTLRSAGQAVLVITAASAGRWGNNLQIGIDYDTRNADSLFNLRVIEFVGGVPGTTEEFRNLSMNSADPGFVVAAVNARSQLITVALAPGLTVTGTGISTSGILSLADLAAIVPLSTDRVAFRVNGQGPFEIAVAPPGAGNLATQLAAVATDMNAKMAANGVGVQVVNGNALRASSNNSERSSVQFLNASSSSATAILRLGLSNGGTEVDGAAGFRPLQTGTVVVPAAAPPASASVSAALVDANVNTLLPAASPTPPIAALRLNVGVNGQEPFEVVFTGLTGPVAAATPALQAEAGRTAIAGAIAAAINARLNANAVAAAASAGTNGTITITSTDATRWNAIHITSAATNDAAAPLRLGLANGGTEDALIIDVRQGTNNTAVHTIRVPLWGFWDTAKATPRPRTLDEAVGDLEGALRTLANREPYLIGARALRVGTGIRIVPGTTAPNDPNTSFVLTGTPAFTANTPNVAAYAPGLGVTVHAQVAGTIGNDGTAPTATEMRGSQAAKTGLYSLENVDIFNLLVMPDATAGDGMIGVLTEAIAYCTRRRAFMILDAPENVARFDQAQAWVNGPASPLRSRNDALYFPRLREPDPLMNGAVRTLPAAGALAGIYARTDAERGVWKAPAGTAATLVGATGLSYTLTDGENGALNPKGLNCLRAFPVIGNVAWGARTGNGADALADEYKYIPVRRLALFLEESLYRGTQWVVFEPNDEPLWAQIRLNLGAFMHTLYARGAFQGQTPRDAYFVRCDKETTTQNDIDLGRVNIVVGFAPLKPAEFVIIQIQQIAGAIKT
jgi:phage tail sheath protein FI